MSHSLVVLFDSRIRFPFDDFPRPEEIRLPARTRINRLIPKADRSEERTGRSRPKGLEGEPNGRYR